MQSNEKIQQFEIEQRNLKECLNSSVYLSQKARESMEKAVLELEIQIVNGLADIDNEEAPERFTVTLRTPLKRKNTYKSYDITFNGICPCGAFITHKEITEPFLMTGIKNGKNWKISTNEQFICENNEVSFYHPIHKLVMG